ncbi:hypothetical protein BGZ90_007262 [Linnemannia elongata]|nr:hypothetical protein BGZ90_007262 [Linnemannia elongata]
MGEHHSDITCDAASPSAAVSLGKETGDDDLTSYIGGSLSPSFKAKVMISDSTNNSINTADCDVDMVMEGVELEVASLAVQSTLTTGMIPQLVQQSTTNDTLAVASTSTFFPSEPLLAAASSATGVETELLREQASPPVGMTATSSTPTSATATPTATMQTEQSELMKDTDGTTEAITPPIGQNEGTEQTPEVEEQEDSDEDDGSDDDNDDSHGPDEEPSMIVTTDAIYSAVPISSELHIFPHSSKGFNWNQDHFLKPHQRRNLGVEELHSTFNASIGGIVRSESSSSTTSSATNSSSSSTSISNAGGGMSAIRVHEIRLDQEETDQILPSRS